MFTFEMSVYSMFDEMIFPINNRIKCLFTQSERNKNAATATFILHER